MRAWRWAGRGWIVACLAFLYLPILLVVAWSFNAGRLAAVWSGFSLRWYEALFHDEALLQALGVTVRVAVLSATLATVLGLCAGLGLARPRRLPAPGLFATAVYAPLVLPDVLLGLSLLLLFVSAGVARGFWTVAIAHATGAVAYVAVVVQARLARVDPSLEEAAQDLGAGPVKAFVTVTLPLIAPAVAAGWLLAFSLSLDDLVLASFTAGPGSTTLPMRLYSQIRLGVNPEINAASTLMILAAATAAGTYALVLRRTRNLGSA
ncbi:MAG TPA: ABC transporter permease [Caulobacteraceae bacterium]|jgi:putrescine transport system permease protein|nr:ABC transporter permease [Caulobacteraceae bacterium]